MKKINVVLLVVIAFALGALCATAVTNGMANKGQTSQSSAAEIVVIDDYPNPCIIEFVATKPIAPVFHVSRGDRNTVDYYLRDEEHQKEWNPLDIDADETLRLLDEVAQVVGIEVGEISAREYTLRIMIPESHVGRKSEIAAEVLEILENFESNAQL